jgi:mannose-1-phosphate guanylyltransferase
MHAAAHAHRWAIVLAGGSGTRLAGVTVDGQGRPVPKQYCSLDGRRSLLGHALARARRVAPAGQVLVVVAAEHERFWRKELRRLPAWCVLAQPCNRGTAPGLLLPLLAILARDPEAVIAMFPSDHHVAVEQRLSAAVAAGLRDARSCGAGITLLGIEADGPETGYGWILPHAGSGQSRGVAAFVEKPDAAMAQRLHAQGALWNSFVMAAQGSALRELYRVRQPALLAAFERAAPHGSAAAAGELYDSLPLADFSRDVLQGAEQRLRVRAVPHCGWTDLGTPERLLRCLQQSGPARAARARVAIDLRQSLSPHAQEAGASRAAMLR